MWHDSGRKCGHTRVLTCLRSIELASSRTSGAGFRKDTALLRCADAGSLEGEAFVALTKTVRARSAYDISQLPPATLACAYSGTDDDSAEEAYAALRAWTDAKGARIVGPKREIYLHEMLEIQFPIESVPL